jgi:DnaA family protein
MKKTVTQLPLAIGLRDDATFDNFYPGDNGQVIGLLQAQLTEVGEQAILLWGNDGVGCTHLLQAAYQDAETRGLGAIYLPMEDVVSYDTEILEGLEQLQLVCIDHVQAIAGNAEWEEALFHLYNRLRNMNIPLLLAADTAPSHSSFVLPDLVSRLSWGMVLQVKPLGDDDKASALQMRAKNRGFELGHELAHYILQRAGRSTSELFSVLEQLDLASLSAQRKLTKPFVKEVLGW